MPDRSRWPHPPCVSNAMICLSLPLQVLPPLVPRFFPRRKHSIPHPYVCLIHPLWQVTCQPPPLSGPPAPASKLAPPERGPAPLCLSPQTSPRPVAGPPACGTSVMLRSSPAPPWAWGSAPTEHRLSGPLQPACNQPPAEPAPSCLTRPLSKVPVLCVAPPGGLWSQPGARVLPQPLAR